MYTYTLNFIIKNSFCQTSRR